MRQGLGKRARLLWIWSPARLHGAPLGYLLNRLRGCGQVRSVFHQLLQNFNSGLEVCVLLCQRLYRDHQDSRHVAGVDGRWRPYGAQAIVPEGGKELLGHRTMVAKLLRVVACLLPY